MKSVFSFFTIKPVLIALAVLVGLANPVKAMDDDNSVSLTITNQVEDELLAPILVAPVKYDSKIFVGDYVSAAAEHQILTGDPVMTVEAIGKKAKVVHDTDGPPAVLLAPGKSVTIEVKARRGEALRIIAMVAPTRYADHFVTAVINTKAGIPLSLDRYDIGHDEDRKSTEYLSAGAALVTIN